MANSYKIKTERQTNGLWGMPLKLKSISGGIKFDNEEKEKLFSAILMAFAETNPDSFWLEMHTHFFIIHTDLKVYNYSLSYFGLDDDELHYLSTDEDRRVFQRKIKLKKLRNKI